MPRASVLATFLVIPLGTVLAATRLAKARGPFWLPQNVDPSYAYLFNSLLMAQGSRVGHTDHPGATVQLLGGAILRVINWLASSEPLPGDVLRKPEFYLDFLRLAVLLIYAAALALGGYIVARATGKLWLGLIVQATPFLAARSIVDLTLFRPEPVLLILSAMLSVIVLVIVSEGRSPLRSSYALALGVLCGLGLATKITFLPLLAVPLLLLSGRRQLLVFSLTTSALSFAITWLVAYKRFAFYGFQKAILLHTGRYGSGPKGIITSELFFERLKYLVSSLAEAETPALLIFGAGMVIFAAVAIASRRLTGVSSSSLACRGLGATLLALILQIIMVTKDPVTPHHYLIPGFGLLGLVLALAALSSVHLVPDRRQYWLAPVSTLCVTGLLLLSWGGIQHQSGVLERERVAALEEYQATESRFPGCTIAYAYGASSPVNARNYGNGYARHKFGGLLKRMFPGVSYDKWNQRFDDYETWVEADAALKAFPCLLIKGGSDELEPPPGVRFTRIEHAGRGVLYRVTNDVGHGRSM